MCALFVVTAGCGDDASSGGMSGAAATTSGGTGVASGAGGSSAAPTSGTGATATGGTGAAVAGGVGGGGASGAGAGGTQAATGGTSASGAGGAGGAGVAGQGGAGGTQPDAGTDAGSGATLADPCVGGGPYGDPLPAMREAQPVAGGFDFIEGPVWIESQGVLLFSDMQMSQAMGSWPPTTVRRLTPPDQVDVFAADVHTNGLALTPQGELIGGAHDVQDLVQIDLDTGARTPLDLRYMGNRFNAPNDLTVRRDGTIYFTDPDWQLAGRTSETGMTGVYRVPPNGEVTLVDGMLDKPNGIALSPDGNTLYVGSLGNDVMAYTLDADGLASDRRVFASPGSSDGMAIDCAGNLYVTAGGVRVFDASGSDLGTITLAESPANVAFGGSDHQTLYITARTGLYSIELNVPGDPY
jgi:gluconolactonase